MTSTHYVRIISAGFFFVIFSDIHSQDIKTAIKCTQYEQFNEAKIIFDDLLITEPTNGDIYFYYGENYLGQYFADTSYSDYHDLTQKATTLFRKGAETDPDNPLCYIGLAKIALLNGDTAVKSYFDIALKKITRKKKGKPALNAAEQAVSYVKIAETMMLFKDKWAQIALPLAEKAAGLDPGNPEIFLEWGDAKCISGIYTTGNMIWLRNIPLRKQCPFWIL